MSGGTKVLFDIKKRKTNLTIAGRGFVCRRPEPLSPSAEQTVAVVAAAAAE